MSHAGTMCSGSSVTVARQLPSNDIFAIIPASHDLVLQRHVDVLLHRFEQSVRHVLRDLAVSDPGESGQFLLHGGAFACIDQTCSKWNALMKQSRGWATAKRMHSTSE